MNLIESIIQTVQKGGLVMYPMILLGIIVFALIIERWLYLSKVIRGSHDFKKTFFSHWSAGRVQEAGECARTHDGPIAKMMSKGIANLSRTKEDVKESIHEEAIAEIPRLERFLSAIATIGTMMPIMGLLGTVTGMISTFDVITVKGTGDPKALASGISEALITTETGLIFALPILLLHSILSSKVDNFTAEMERATTSFLTQIPSGAENHYRKNNDEDGGR